MNTQTQQSSKNPLVAIPSMQLTDNFMEQIKWFIQNVNDVDFEYFEVAIKTPGTIGQVVQWFISNCHYFDFESLQPNMEPEEFNLYKKSVIEDAISYFQSLKD